MLRRPPFLLTFLLLSIAAAAAPAAATTTTTTAPDGDAAASDQAYFVVSGYTNTVSTYTLNLTSGEVALLGNSSLGQNASWVAWHPSNTAWAYAVQETAPDGGVAFLQRDSANVLHISPEGSLSSHGSSPCHTSVHPDGKWLFAANYDNGYTSVFPIDAATGRILNATAVLHDGNNAHMMAVHAVEKRVFVYTPFLGSDYVAQYEFDATAGTLKPLSPAVLHTPAGCGPRHLAIHPSTLVGYLICETASQVHTVAIERATGTLKITQSLSTIPGTFNASDNTGAEVLISPNGQYVYCSNRGHNSIAIFRVESKEGYTLVPLGWEIAEDAISKPRSMAIHPSGNWLIVANQDANSFTTLKLNAGGSLIPITTTTGLAFGPAFVGFLP